MAERFSHSPAPSSASPSAWTKEGIPVCSCPFSEVDCCSVLLRARLPGHGPHGQDSALSKAHEPDSQHSFPPVHGSQALPSLWGKSWTGPCFVLVHDPGTRGYPPLVGTDVFCSCLFPGTVGGSLPGLPQWLKDFVQESGLLRRHGFVPTAQGKPACFYHQGVGLGSSFWPQSSL